MKKLLSVSVLVSLVFAAGCRPSLTAAGRGVQQVPAAPEGCTFVGPVTGWVDYTGPSGRNDAKVKARNAAGELGANTIVWTVVDSGAFDSQVEGQAYRCPSP